MFAKMIAIVFAGLLVEHCPAAAAEQMTVDFSWHSVRGCVTLLANPEIHLRDIPPGAASVLITLAEGSRDLGGQEVLMPESGILPAGSVRTFAPCNPGVYAYTVVVKASSGVVLARARQARSYPADDVQPEKGATATDLK